MKKYKPGAIRTPIFFKKKKKLNVHVKFSN